MVQANFGNGTLAPEFFGSFLNSELSSKHDTMASMDLGNQFIALVKLPDHPRDHDRLRVLGSSLQFSRPRIYDPADHTAVSGSSSVASGREFE